MMIKKIKYLAVVALLGGAFLTPSSQAQVTVHYSTGDLLLGFQATGGTGAANDYLVDIGPFSSFTGSITLSLGNLGADLTSTFGSGWYNRSDLQWAILGTNGTGIGFRTLYLSKQETTVGTQVAGFTGKSSSTQASPAVNINTIGIGSGAYDGSTSTTNSSVAIIQTAANSNTFSKLVSNNGTNSIDTVAGGYGGSVLGNFGNGTAGSVLDLFSVSPPNGTVASYIGSFQLNNSGGLSFSTSPIPEPSTVALLGLGLGSLFALRRLESKTKAKVSKPHAVS